MIVLIILVLIVIAGMGWTKYQGAKALTFTHVDVTGLSLDEIVAIGSKASGSLTGRANREHADRPAYWGRRGRVAGAGSGQRHGVQCAATAGRPGVPRRW